MNKMILTTVFLAVTVAWATVSATAQKSVTAERAVEFQSYAGARYFESNDSSLKGNASYLVFTSQENFDRIFHPAAVMGDNLFLPDNVFDTKLVVAIVKRGESIYKYDLKKVTLKKKKLYIRYDAAPENQAAKARDNGSYSFSTAIFLTVDKNNYSEIVFMENGKRVGTTPLPKIK